jgi:hypothetical protein
VTYRGICADCQAAKPEASASASPTS